MSTPPGHPVAVAVIEQGGGWLSDAAIPDPVRGLFLGWGCVYVEAYYPTGNLERAVTATQHAIQYAKAQAPNWNHADPNRIFVSGASAGGFNAVRAAMLEGVWRVGGYSAACLSMVGAPVPVQPTSQILQQVIGGDRTLWAAHTPYAHLADAGVHRLTGKLFHSTGDSQIPLAWIITFVKEANRQGHALTLYVQQGGQHMSVCPGAWSVTDAQVRTLVQEQAGMLPAVDWDGNGRYYDADGGEYDVEARDLDRTVQMVTEEGDAAG